MHKLLFLILILSPLILNAAVDESKTDVYFANGVDTTREEARKAMNKVLRPSIEKEIFSGDTAKMDQQIGKFDLLYNETHGLSNDLAEAILQKISTGNDFLDVFRSYFYMIGGEKGSNIDLTQLRRSLFGISVYPRYVQ